VIDQLRDQIKNRLGELEAEAGRLRTALGALGNAAAPATTERTPAAPRRPRSAAPTREARATATAAAPARRTRRAATRSPRRTASGSTKAAVLSALASGEAMTASQVAAKAGLGRASVSTTLSKLAKNGDVQKAARGYQLQSAGRTPATTA
jgi:DNA-binding transcriptional ArsR family regulator